MPRFLLLYFILLCATIASCTSDKINRKNTEAAFKKKKLGNGILTFDKKIHDLGIINEGTIVYTTFPFKNTGNDTLKINRVQPDCYCTAYSVSKLNIAPGDTAKIAFKIDTKGKTGKNTLYSTVSANTKDELYSLKIIMDVN